MTTRFRVCNALSLISAILLACVILVWAYSFWSDPHTDRISVNEALHNGLYNSHVEFFSNATGQYHGSIISLGDGNDEEFAERRGFGDAYGIAVCPP